MKFDERENQKCVGSNAIDILLEASYDGIAIFNMYGEVLQSGGVLLNKIGERYWKDIQKVCQEVIHSGKRITCLIHNVDLMRSFLLTANPVFVDKKRITHVVCNIRDLEDLNELGHEADASTLHENNDFLSAEGLEYKEELKNFITRSVAMQSVLTTAIRVAQVDSTILIMGESGVGKGILARLIQGVSKRKTQPFVKISCGAIPEQLLESELFGYGAGAFTGAHKNGKPGLFEIAGNGTVFLDEVAELPLSLQVKLLNVLQDKTFMRVGCVKELKTNARIIAATNKNLELQVKNGAFRADLFYRLHVIPIIIPPLRERKGDILPLGSHFLQIFNERYGFKHIISPAVFDCFVRYDWPGNVRELQNLIEYLVVMTPDNVIEVHNLPVNILESLQKKGVTPNASGKVTLKGALEEYERDLIVSVLTQHQTLKDAADSLGIDISTLTRKKQKYCLSRG
ncbi:MAG TPA: sigma 54-interacting transcriptional regulator [Negativicutes bacterium]|jgi:transcriptional regulator with PAS, ATPase and Fis domain